MMSRLLVTGILFSSLAALSIDLSAEESHAPPQEIKLSQDLLNLLRAEMKEISTGVQNIAVALTTADWKTIQDCSEKIRASYVLEKKLTPEQEKELAPALPERFKQLDAEFHQRAAKLGEAASAHDAELVVFHYGRLIESCTQCHALYARSRFPGFAPSTPPEHHHH